jgi:hypothetical protein
MFINILKIILKIFIPLSLVFVGVAFAILLIFVVINPKDTKTPALTKRVSGCIRSSLSDPSLSGTTVASCDHFGTTYTEYFCDDPKGCKDPDSDEIFFGSKIITEPCQPKCISNSWNISTVQDCRYLSEIQDDPCIENGEIPKRIRTYACLAQDLKGMPGCVITGNQSLINQFLEGDPEKCKMVPDLTNTVKCDTGAIVTVTEDCEVLASLPICGEYRVKTTIPVQNPITGQLYPPTDPRSIDYKKCTANNVGLMDLQNTCYKPNKTGVYNSITDLFNVGVSRIPTTCVKIDPVTGEQTTTNAVCKKSTNIVETGPLYLPGDLDYHPPDSTTDNPDCLQPCLYYGVPSVPDPSTFENFKPIIGKYFVMIAHTLEFGQPKRYMISYSRSLAREQTYIGTPSSLIFGDMLGKSGDYIDDSQLPITLIDIDEILHNKGTYGIMTETDPSKPICDENVILETNAVIFVADYISGGSSNKYRFEIYGYCQNKLGFIAGDPRGGQMNMGWVPISNKVAQQMVTEDPLDNSGFNDTIAIDSNGFIDPNAITSTNSIVFISVGAIVGIRGDSSLQIPVPPVGSVNAIGKYGTLTIQADGHWTYTRDLTKAPLGSRIYDPFVYTFQNSSMIISQAYLLIRSYQHVDIHSMYIDLEYSNDIAPQPGDSPDTYRKLYNLNYAGRVVNSRDANFYSNPPTAGFGASHMSRLRSERLIDISINNTPIINGSDIVSQGIEIINVGERISQFGVQPKIDIATIISGRNQRTAHNCNLFFRLPVPTDYNY